MRYVGLMHGRSSDEFLPSCSVRTDQSRCHSRLAQIYIVRYFKSYSLTKLRALLGIFYRQNRSTSYGMSLEFLYEIESEMWRYVEEVGSHYAKRISSWKWQ